MRDTSDLVKLIRDLSSNTLDTKKPPRLMQGQVTSIRPLKILVEQRLELTQSFLIVPEHLTDYSVSAKVGNSGRQTITFYNGLKPGDRVILLSDLGSQLFYVLDRRG